MQIVPLASVEIRKRQRSEIPAGHVSKLHDSILERGLLHPPVCWHDDEKDVWVLTVGECRTRAIKLIAAEGKTFHHGDTSIPPGSIPITTLGEYLDDVGRFEAELDENIQRADLSWQDRARALNDLHEMRLARNSKQSMMDTAKELIAGGANVVTPRTAASGEVNPRSVEMAIYRSRIVATHLGNEKIANARNEAEALQLVYKMEEERAKAALAKRQLSLLPSKPLLEVRHGDLLLVLPQMEDATVDLVLADPPYGIGASSGGFRSRSVHHHNYEDTPESAKAIALSILTEGFRLSKPRANLLIFCDIDLFPWLKSTAQNMGWTPFRRPLIWQKSESEGLAPWGGSGPRITTEFIFYATKGARAMTSSPVDWFNFKRVPRHERLHAAEKPVELLSRLIELTTLPGEVVLDPCCGSGSTLIACRETKRRGIGIERDQDYFTTAMANVHGNKPTEAEDVGAT